MLAHTQAEELGLAGPLDDGSRIQEGTVWLVMNATYGLLQVSVCLYKFFISDDGSRTREGTVWLVMNATYGLLQVSVFSQVFFF